MVLPALVLGVLVLLYDVAALPTSARIDQRSSEPLTLPLARYERSAPPLIARADKSPVSTSLTPDPLGRFGYALSLQVGPQELLAEVDTGASNTFLYAKACRSDVCSSRDDVLYGHSAASFDASNEKGGWGFVEGSAVTGVWATDVFQVAKSEYSVKNQRFLYTVGGTTQLPDGVTGIVGFGWPQSGTQSNEWPFWYRLLPSWKQKMFSVYLGKDKSELTLNGINANCVEGGEKKVTYVDVKTFFSLKNLKPFKKFKMPQEWTIPLQSAAVGDQILDIDSEVVVDTDANAIYAPVKEVEGIYGKLVPASRKHVTPANPDQAIYSFKCKSTDVPPQITLAFSNTVSITFDAWYWDPSNRMCLSNIISSNKATDWVIGHPGFQKSYVVFQAEPKPRIGFGPLKAKNPCEKSRWTIE